jgi:hypothetical protein
MNPDGQTFFAHCPICNERRSVTCKSSDLKTDAPVKARCELDHVFTLSPEQRDKLSKMEAILGSNR